MAMSSTAALVVAILPRKMAQQAVAQHAISIRLACKAFGISETCYRYQAKLSDDNALIAEQLIELTEENSDWGLVCASRIYGMLRVAAGITSGFTVFTELALNLRIKPRRRLKRHAPEPLKEPTEKIRFGH
jgi:putative transposase